MKRQRNHEMLPQRRYPPYRSGIPTQEQRTYLEALGKVLRRARMAHNWSYRMQAKHIGKDAGTWCRLEHGQQRPRPETLRLAADGLRLNYHLLVELVGHSRHRDPIVTESQRTVQDPRREPGEHSSPTCGSGTRSDQKFAGGNDHPPSMC